MTTTTTTNNNDKQADGKLRRPSEELVDGLLGPDSEFHEHMHVYIASNQNFDERYITLLRMLPTIWGHPSN